MAVLPDYWWPTDGDTTIVQESGQLYRRHGSYSVHVTAPNSAFAGDPTTDPVTLPRIGSGIVSSPFNVRFTEFKPYLTIQISLWVVVGAVRLELWDIRDCAAGDIDIWPPRSSTPRAVTTELGNWVDNLAVAPGEDFWRGGGGAQSIQFQVAIVADVENSEWYSDAAMATNTVSGATTFYEGKSSNELLLAANEELLLKSTPLSSYDMSTLELSRLDPILYPDEEIGVGGTGRIRVREFGELDLKRRMLNTDKNLFKETDTKVAFETELGFLTRNMAKTERRRRVIQQAPPEESGRPANVEAATGSFDDGVLEVNIQPAVGASYYEVREQGPGDTAVERFDNGRKLGPRQDSTRIVISDITDRDYDLTVRSYNRTAVGSATPYELSVQNIGSVNKPFMPSDVDLRFYVSFDEKYDQAGNELLPADWTQLISGEPEQLPAAEIRKRRRYDQSQDENHVRLCTYANTAGAPPTSGAYTTEYPQTKKPGVSNSCVTFGDNPTALGRKTLFDADTYACVDEEASTGGQTGLDMIDDFTLVTWVNPCLLYPRTWTAEALNVAHQYTMIGRMGQISWDYSPLPAGVNWATRGYFWYLGGVPKDFSNSWSPDLTATYGTVPGIGFYYLPTLNPNGNQDDNDFALGNRAALFWPWEYPGSLDSNNDGSNYAVDAGEYSGWQFFALRISAEITTDSDWPLGASDFTLYAGWADGRKLYNVGTQRGASLRGSMWTSNTGSTAGAFHVDGDEIMVSLNCDAVNRRQGQTGDNPADLYYDSAIWGDTGLPMKFDESRIYSRALSAGEIAALYAHPGGQKRTENLLETERQI